MKMDIEFDGANKIAVLSFARTRLIDVHFANLPNRRMANCQSCKIVRFFRSEAIAR